MLEILTLVVGNLETNCYLVSCPSSDDEDSSSQVAEWTPGTVESNEPNSECLVIDPGDDADFITQTILDKKLKPTAIVLTHGHFDHVLGCLELKLNFDIPIMLHKNDEELYSSANQSALHWLKKKTLKVPPVDQFIKEGDKISLGDEFLSVIETPGHTPGSICLFSAFSSPRIGEGGTATAGGEVPTESYVLFTGDTLFKDGVGRTDFSYSKPLQLTKSLDKLFELPKETIIYPGHGESSTIGAEKTISS